MRATSVLALLAGCAATFDPASDGGVDPTTDSGPRPAGGSSKGTGGLACDATGALSGQGTWCETTIGQASVRLSVPRAETLPPYRLAVHFHGDDAAQYRDNSALDAHQFWVIDRSVLMISILAPNGCSWWQRTACGDDRDDAQRNVIAAREVIEAIKAAYDVRNDEHLFVSVSGGSIFVMSSFFPRLADDYPGAYVINCGGGTPWDDALSWSQLVDTKLYFRYGDGDFLRGEIEESIAYYRGKVLVDEKIFPGEGHCTYHQASAIQEAWEDFLRD